MNLMITFGTLQFIEEKYNKLQRHVIQVFPVVIFQISMK